MKRLLAVCDVRALRALAVLLLAATAAEVRGDTLTLTRTVVTDGTNRPFFDPAAVPGFANDSGYVGTATPNVSNSSTVTATVAGLGGNSSPLVANNDVPLGIGLDFGVSFTVETVTPAHLLTDAGNAGLGVNSGGESGTNPTRLNAGETLHFSPISLTPITVYDPLGLWVAGSASLTNPLWRSLRTNTNQAANSPTVTVSSDDAGTQDVFTFAPTGAQGVILNDDPGVFPAISTVYVNTQAGSNAWPLKGIGYQMDLNFTPAAPVPSRRFFYFGDPDATYDTMLTHQITATDTTVTVTAVGDASAALDTNDLGVGVNSGEDDLTAGLPTSNTQQRFINGSLTTPEAINLSFDRDVALESLTLGNIDLDGSESVVLKFVSGMNPFTGLTGYSGDYSLGADSLAFTHSGGGQTPYAITFGKGGQDELVVQAGTVLSLTANPAVGHGFILDMLTVNVPTAGPDADFDDDGDVDQDDLATWTTNFGSTSATGATGDADGDGDADGADFLKWQQQHTGMLAAATVPEPAAGGLMLLALLAGTRLRKR